MPEREQKIDHVMDSMRHAGMFFGVTEQLRGEAVSALAQPYRFYLPQRVQDA